MKPYSEYKDTGLEWLGSIPLHWNARRVKYLFHEIQEKSVSGEEDLLSVSQYTGVTLYPEDEVMRAKTLEGYKTVKKGDLVINIMLAWLGALAVSDFNGVVSPAYCVYRANPEHNPKYFGHLFKTGTYLAEFARQSRGVVESRWRMYTDDFYGVTAIIPPRSEQDAIIAYLEAKLADIDRYIAEKKRLIELLQEQKTALINQAVTRGLNPQVRMKPSGIEWRGEIPEHWEVVSNRRLFREKANREPDGTEIPLSLSQKDGIVATDDLKERTLLTASRENFKVCLPHDLIANRFKAHLGVFFEAKIRGVVTFHYGVFCPLTSAKTRYFEYLFHSEPYKLIYAGASNGMVVGLQNLSNQSFYSVKSIVPPINEQVKILEYINEVNAEFDRSIEMTQNQIEKMQEYRTALIAEAVTGKIDVRS